jgi:hypothetical protein
VLGRRGVYALWITCCDGWPGLIVAAERAIASVMPTSSVFRRARIGCHDIKSTSKHWPCLFPQHGPGRKHQRRIELEAWQQVIVTGHPGDFTRGLFHSDATAASTGFAGHWLTVTVGMSIRGTCSSTIPPTSCVCAARRWTGSTWNGGSASGTRSPSLTVRGWPGSTSSGNRSTDAPGALAKPGGTLSGAVSQMRCARWLACSGTGPGRPPRFRGRGARPDRWVRTARP